mgnify:CR=1 FL=1
MYDIVIIGSGPAGLSAAIYAQRENLKAVVVEREFMGTGQIAESERVDNYPGFYGETGFDLGEKFRTHAEKLGAEFVEGEVLEGRKIPALPMNEPEDDASDGSPEDGPQDEEDMSDEFGDDYGYDDPEEY